MEGLEAAILLTFIIIIFSNSFFVVCTNFAFFLHFLRTFCACTVGACLPAVKKFIECLRGRQLV